MIRLLYFARLRESLGSSGEALVLPPGVGDVAGVLALLAARGGVWEAELTGGIKGLRVAVNQTLADTAAAVGDGDEVAIFPPVTGG